MTDKPNQSHSETQWKSVSHYDMEICGVCHGRGLIWSGYGGKGIFPIETNYPCPNCKDSPRPGYIIIPNPKAEKLDKIIAFTRNNEEFRPDEKDE